MRTSTTIVAAYGSIDMNSEGTANPEPCACSCRMVTPPNRYAPRSARHGFQVAKTTSANAIQPRPEPRPSDHNRVSPPDRDAPASPAIAPPNITATERTTTPREP